MNIEDVFKLIEDLKNLLLIDLKENKFGIILNENGHGSFLIEPTDKKIKKLILCFKSDKIKTIFIYTDFIFNFSFLCKHFGKYREVYVPRDDEYIYYFNEFNDFTFFIGYRSNKQLNKTSEINIDNLEIIYKNDV